MPAEMAPTTRRLGEALGLGLVRLHLVRVGARVRVAVRVGG